MGPTTRGEVCFTLVVTDALADLLLTPSRDADENLVRKGWRGSEPNPE